MTENRTVQHRFSDSHVLCRSLRASLNELERSSTTGNDVHDRHVEGSVGLLKSESLRSGIRRQVSCACNARLASRASRNCDHETNESPTRGIAGRTWC